MISEGEVSKMKINKNDVVILIDNRHAIVHEIYAEGKALLVEVISNKSQIADFPLISARLVKMVQKSENEETNQSKKGL